MLSARYERRKHLSVSPRPPTQERKASAKDEAFFVGNSQVGEFIVGFCLMVVKEVSLFLSTIVRV
jgi:hypothetical protein